MQKTLIAMAACAALTGVEAGGPYDQTPARAFMEEWIRATVVAGR
jgi:hypothetical protein